MTEVNHINNQQVCNECDRHCPLDALRCGRGRKAAGQLNQDVEFSSRERGDRERGDRERGDRERGDRSSGRDRREREC
ncbi:MAG: hypothetical protein ACI4S0_04410, partial [Dorea sp.]